MNASRPIIGRYSLSLFNRMGISISFSLLVFAGRSQDSLLRTGAEPVLLKEVVVRSNLNVAAFIDRVKKDSSFYKAFRNLQVLSFISLNNIQLFDKKGRLEAGLESRTRQSRAKGCRWTEVIDEKTEGDFYDRHHRYNYYTAEMYAGLFFSFDTLCGETNIVSGYSFSTRDKKGLERHKEQLKMLFFNPGNPIPGIPFIGNKVALFDGDVSSLYDFVIDMDSYHGEMCYVFSIAARPDLTSAERNRVVINKMVTWFRITDWEIAARTYNLSYDAGVYDFDVNMEVEMTRYGNLTVPSLLRYNGNWKVMFKPRERAVFTATLFGFADH